MRNLSKLVVTGFMVLALISCGKENGSGGGSSSSSSSSSLSSSGKVYKNLTEIRNAFDKMSLVSGVKENMVIYHIGPDFGGQDFVTQIEDFDFSDLFDFDFNYCININGDLSGECENFQGPTQNNQLIDIINRGEYKVVKTLDKNGLGVDFANEVFAQGFGFERATYSKDDELYKAMLRYDGKSTVKIIVSEAKMTIRDKSNKVKEIKGNYIEYFYSDYSLKGFVVSTALPVLANPIATTQNHDLTGVLSFSGEMTVQSVQVNIHDIEYDVFTNTYKAITIGTRQVNF